MFRIFNILKKQTLVGFRKKLSNNLILNTKEVNYTQRINTKCTSASLFGISCIFFIPLTVFKKEPLSSVHNHNNSSAESKSVNVYFNLNNCRLPVDHPHCRSVERVVKKLLHANQDIVELKKYPWTVTIVDHDSTNAFAWQSGHLLMSRGLMELFDSEDQLAWVLAHEMSHVILKHHIGFLALVRIMLTNEFIFWFPMACAWTSLTSVDLAVVSLGHMLMNEVINIFHDLPYSRRCEKEADILGLRLASQANYDVNQVSSFLSRKEHLDQKFGRCICTWLSTHPSNLERLKYLTEEIDRGPKLKNYNI